MINANYVHVHSACPKCGGCIYECEHRVRTTITTTGVTDLVTPDPKASQDAHQSAQRPNTDSRELDDLINKIVLGDLDPMPPLEKFDEETQAKWHEWKTALTAYTANKQKEVLEWVEQEVIGPDLPLIPHGITGQPSDAVIAMNHEFERQREQLKNKKESL